MFFINNLLILILLIFIQLPTIASSNIESNKLALEKLASFKVKQKRNTKRKDKFLGLYGTHDFEVIYSEDDIGKQKIFISDVTEISKKEALFTYKILYEDGTVSNANQIGFINNKFMFFHWAIFDIHRYYALKYKIKKNKLTARGFEMLFNSLLDCDSSTNTSLSCQVIDAEDMPPSLVSPVRINK